MQPDEASVARRQVSTVCKHLRHISDVFGLEVTDIDVVQEGAAIEHTLHAVHVSGVEVGDIDGAQVSASCKHLLHRCGGTCVEVFQSVDGRELSHALEPLKEIHELHGAETFVEGDSHT